MKKRVVSWFSCGAASAVATKLALEKYGPERLVVAYCATGAEHPDNQRFLHDVESWLGITVIELQSSEFSSTWDVWAKRRFLRGKDGAACTAELKISPRIEFQRPDDIHIFGYTYDGTDIRRAKNFRENFPEIILETPLIDHGIDKPASMSLLTKAGLDLPLTYALGFRNANCIPCVKASSPRYWSLVRREFPHEFNKMVDISRDLGVRLTWLKGEKRFIDEIPKDFPATDAISPTCDFLCNIVETDLASGSIWIGAGLEIDIASSSEDDENIVIGLKRRRGGITKCHYCQSSDIGPNGSRKVFYRDVPVRGKTTRICWEKQRFYCNNCKKSSLDEDKSFHPEFRMTVRLFQRILTFSKNSSGNSIAAEFGLDEKTIRKVKAAGSKAANPD